MWQFSPHNVYFLGKFWPKKGILIQNCLNKKLDWARPPPQEKLRRKIIGFGLPSLDMIMKKMIMMMLLMMMIFTRVWPEEGGRGSAQPSQPFPSYSNDDHHRHHHHHHYRHYQLQYFPEARLTLNKVCFTSSEIDSHFLLSPVSHFWGQSRSQTLKSLGLTLIEASLTFFRGQSHTFWCQHKASRQSFFFTRGWPYSIYY